MAAHFIDWVLNYAHRQHGNNAVWRDRPFMNYLLQYGREMVAGAGDVAHDYAGHAIYSMLFRKLYESYYSANTLAEQPLPPPPTEHRLKNTIDSKWTGWIEPEWFDIRYWDASRDFSSAVVPNVDQGWSNCVFNPLENTYSLFNPFGGDKYENRRSRDCWIYSIDMSMTWYRYSRIESIATQDLFYNQPFRIIIVYDKDVNGVPIDGTTLPSKIISRGNYPPSMIPDTTSHFLDKQNINYMERFAILSDEIIHLSPPVWTAVNMTPGAGPGTSNLGIARSAYCNGANYSIKLKEPLPVIFKNADHTETYGIPDIQTGALYVLVGRNGTDGDNHEGVDFSYNCRIGWSEKHHSQFDNLDVFEDED